MISDDIMDGRIGDEKSFLFYHSMIPYGRTKHVAKKTIYNLEVWKIRYA